MTPSPDRETTGDLPSPLSRARAKRYLRREFRRHATESEQKLWSLLRSRTIKKYKFRRQHPIGGYIVDFCCLEKRLVIELDGEIHKSQIAEDAHRTRAIQDRGFHMLRFRNENVISQPKNVVETINITLTSIQRTVSTERARLYSWNSPLHTQGRGGRGEGGT